MSGQVSAYYAPHLGRSIDRDTYGRVGSTAPTSLLRTGQFVERGGPLRMAAIQSYLGADTWPPSDLLPPFRLPTPGEPTPFTLPVWKVPQECDTCTGKAAIYVLTLEYSGPQTKCPRAEWTGVIRPRFRRVRPPIVDEPEPTPGDEGPILIDPGANLPVPVQVGWNLVCYTCDSPKYRCLSRFRPCVVVKESLTCKCQEGDLET